MNWLQTLLPNPRKETIKEPKKTSAINLEDMKAVFTGAEYQRSVDFLLGLTMQRLANIFSEAASGRLYELFDMYRNIIASDARLHGIYNTRRQGCAHAPYTVTSPDKDNALAQEACDLVKKNLEQLNMQTIREQLFQGISYGVVISEKIWHIVDGVALIKDIKLIDYSRYEMEMTVLANSELYGELKLLTNGQYQFVKELNPTKILLATKSSQPGYYDMDAFMRPVARWYLLKTFAIQSWAQIAETYNFPVVIVKMPEAEFKKNKGIINKLLSSVGPNKYGIFFDTMQYEVHNQSTPGSSSMLKDFIEMCNIEMTIAILSQNLSSEVQGGSYAAAETLLKILQFTLADDISWINEVIDKQIVDDITRKNFPTLPYHLYPKFSSQFDQPVNLSELSAGLMGMSRLIKIPVDYIYERSQIPTPDENQEVIGGLGSNVFSAFETN